jgi:hypothetical protein
MLRKHIFLACFAMFVLATLVLANAYRAKADTPPPASLSASQLCSDQLLTKVLVAAPRFAARNAKGRKTECGL